MKNLVEPIKDVNDLNNIIKYLKNYDIRYYTIFMIGLYSGLRISDICNLDIDDVKNKDYIEVIEQKTGKYKRFPLNENLQSIIYNYLLIRDDYYGVGDCENALFIGKQHKRLDRYQVYRIICRACKECNIKGNFGTHTMRKTFGYHHYRQFKDIALLQTIFNHSSQVITKRYIGISQEEIDTSYKDFCYTTDNYECSLPKNRGTFRDIENGLDYLLNLYKRLDNKLSKLLGKLDIQEVE